MTAISPKRLYLRLCKSCRIFLLNYITTIAIRLVYGILRIAFHVYIPHNLIYVTIPNIPCCHLLPCMHNNLVLKKMGTQQKQLEYPWQIS